MIDEFELMKSIQESLIDATPTMASRILRYLTDWNQSRPLPLAGDK